MNDMIAPSETACLPIPPDNLHCVGDGDFLAIGREFLGHLIQHADLTPTDTVLDVGCGHPGFGFIHLNLFHPLYNPAGTMSATHQRWPVPSASIDVVFLTSVFTHLTAAETRQYLREIARVLKPGGRCLGTWFLLEEARMPEGADYRLSFAEGEDGAFYDTLTSVPTAAVAYRTDWVRMEVERVGLDCTILPGHWRAAEGAVSYQDITILRRSEGGG